MNEIFNAIEKELNIPCYFLERQRGINECIVYNYRQNSFYSDEKIENTTYDCFINLICTNNINANINKLKTSLINNRFRKISIQQTIKEKNLYETVIFCKKIL